MHQEKEIYFQEAEKLQREVNALRGVAISPTKVFDLESRISRCDSEVHSLRTEAKNLNREMEKRDTEHKERLERTNNEVFEEKRRKEESEKYCEKLQDEIHEMRERLMSLEREDDLKVLKITQLEAERDSAKSLIKAREEHEKVMQTQQMNNEVYQAASETKRRNQSLNPNSNLSLPERDSVLEKDLEMDYLGSRSRRSSVTSVDIQRHLNMNEFAETIRGQDHTDDVVERVRSRRSSVSSEQLSTAVKAIGDSMKDEDVDQVYARIAARRGRVIQVHAKH